MTYLAEILLGVMALGVVLGMGSRRDLAESFFLLLAWPVVLPVMAGAIILGKFGFFVKWRGPLDQVQRAKLEAAYRSGLWAEQSWGPAYAGTWIKQGALNRWYGLGIPGGRGVLVGRSIPR